MTALETVKDILSKQLRVDIDSITEDTNIMEDLGADSLDIVEMLMNIEQDYGIVIADDDIVGFKTPLREQSHFCVFAYFFSSEFMRFRTA